MKKSEMISLIKSQLESLFHKKIDIAPCELLLEAIEKAGILPPLSDLGKELACTSDHDNRDIDKAYNYFKWDES